MNSDVTFNDLFILALYLSLIFIIAFFSKRRKLDKQLTDNEIIEDQYMASRSLSFIESLGSIIATEVSALTFLGIPAYAFSGNFNFILIYVGAILGRFFIARNMLPYLYNKGITVYSIIALNNNGTKEGRRELALIYSISKILAVGVRLFSGSILVAEFFDINIHLAIFLTTAITYLYTLIGGLKAVVRTDLLQASIFIIGGVSAYFIIPDVTGMPLTQMFQDAFNANKFSLASSAGGYSEILIGIVGGVVFDMATHGVDQDFAVRLMAAKSFKSAQKAIFFSSFASIFVGLLFLGVGSLLWSYSNSFPFPEEIKSDRVFAYFITRFYPPYLKGLMLAGVIAATMSTLDSTINALSSVMWSDLIPGRNIHLIKRYLITDASIICALLLLVAHTSSQFDGLLILGLKVASWSGGFLLGIFMGRLNFKNFLSLPCTAPAVIFSYLANLMAVALCTYVFKISWQWNVLAGAIATIIALAIHGKILALMKAKSV